MKVGVGGLKVGVSFEDECMNKRIKEMGNKWNGFVVGTNIIGLHSQECPVQTE